MKLSFSKILIARTKSYVRANWGAPFIVAFMGLLMIAAVSLALNWSALVDTVAVYAYYALVVGVVLQLVCFLRYRERNGTVEAAI